MFGRPHFARWSRTWLSISRFIVEEYPNDCDDNKYQQEQSNKVTFVPPSFLFLNFLVTILILFATTTWTGFISTNFLHLSLIPFRISN